MAPAGGPDAGYAAFQHGADAIYLGLGRFSARADAENFILEQADALTAYAHSLDPRRRVYLALNTLVLQNELAEVVDVLGQVTDIGIDAVIVQDLGVYYLIRRHFPGLRLHASTQMAVHNRAGVEALRQLGFARATLARELTLPEIRDVAAVPGIETEVFIHGALCYAYSGLCLFSSHTTGRSGNRGRCAQMCRDRYRPAGAGKHQGLFVFSMKDLALPGLVRDLREAGVRSFKIEGRKKNASYVAATTQYYRDLLDGTLRPGEEREREADLRTIFSRPWTTLHVGRAGETDVIDPVLVGHRGILIGKVERVVKGGGGRARLRFRTSRAIERHDGLQVDIEGLDKPFGFAVDELRVADSNGGWGGSAVAAPAGSIVEVALPQEHPQIPIGAPVCCASSQDVKRRYRFTRPRPGTHRCRSPFDLVVSVSPTVVRARAAAGEIVLEDEVQGQFEVARDAGRTAEAIRTAFGKLGDTKLELGGVEVANPDGLFVPVSLLNEMRRRVATGLQDALDGARREQRDAIKKAITAGTAPGPRASEEVHWSLKTDRLSHVAAFQAEDWQGLDELVIDISCRPEDLDRVAESVGRERIRLALPIITRRWQVKDLLARIETFRRAGWAKWEASNLSAWSFLNLPLDPRPSTLVPLSSDWSVYVTNRLAALQVLEMGASRFALSPEDGLENIRSMLAEFGARATVIVYQDTPLFLSENAPAWGRDGGKQAADLVSSHGDEVIALQRQGRTVVIHWNPFCLGRRLADLAAAGAVSLRADFVWREYDPEEVVGIWRGLRSGAGKPEGRLANFDRGLL
ncbi:MAG: U32 family peptidase [Kiritimatiellae bacterium]|nr:U32 family peptidase [Kiritimatiellia bacterium]